jgi:hypothetical protein
LHKIHPSIENGESKFFKFNELSDWSFENAEHRFLIFLPDYQFRSIFYYLLNENNFKLFNDLVDKIEINLKEITKFIDSDQFINKMADALIVFLENRGFIETSLGHSLRFHYCYLFFKRSYFGLEYDDDDEVDGEKTDDDESRSDDDDDDDDDDDNTDDDDDFFKNDDVDLMIVLNKKKSRKTSGSITTQNVILIEKLLRRIYNNIQKRFEFLEYDFFDFTQF